MVAYEADVSGTDKFNNTPIHYAALANEPKVCQFLFQRGFYQNYLDLFCWFKIWIFFSVNYQK